LIYIYIYIYIFMYIEDALFADPDWFNLVHVSE
jgi:hypothetical protein